MGGGGGEPALLPHPLCGMKEKKNVFQFMVEKKEDITVAEDMQ